MSEGSAIWNGDGGRFPAPNGRRARGRTGAGRRGAGAAAGVARIGRNARPARAGLRTFPRGIVITGREAELARLTGLAGQTSRRGLPVVVAVSGPPGTGRTTLALQAAHELADRFTDGQLLLDPRGMDDDPTRPRRADAERAQDSWGGGPGPGAGRLAGTSGTVPADAGRVALSAGAGQRP
ncbi:AAA family ATPase [Streptomyces sp. NPDC004783]|uniref:AAA family ATPase n=1 Tax=Streptomyces sp. NPDC004783 TaxID=3154459 RepID=UPI0033A7B5DD